MVYTTALNVQNELKLKAAFSSSTTPTLSIINEWIEQESSWVDSKTSNRFKQADVTVLIDYNGEERIQLPSAPIRSIDHIKYATHSLGTSDYPSFETKEEDLDYTVYADRGEISILFNRWRPRPGLKRIEIAYKSGYTTTPTYITKLVTKLVSKRLMDSQAQSMVNSGSAGKSYRLGSVHILNNSPVSARTYENTMKEINDLTEQLVTQNSTAIRFINY